MLLKDLVLVVISFLFLLIFVLVGVAFLTLLERKVLGYIQIRKGPNKVGVMGLLQPFGDAIKLFSKEQVYPFMSNLFIYYFSPLASLIISLIMWMLMPFWSGLLEFNLGILFFLCVSSLGVYTVMMSGWSSNSNYAMLGALRAVAQTISYEVSLSLILMSFIFLISGFKLINFYIYQEFIWLFFLMFPLVLMFIVSALAETNRTPFDFAEGESELVSGFNVEYSSGGFAMIFLAEYSSILFMSMISVMMFMGADFYSFLFFIKLAFISFFWLWVRGTLPRYRYDKLMGLAWKIYLPVSLFLLMFFLSLELIVMVLNF